MSRKGKLFLVLGPSGSGKGTLIQALKAKHLDFVYPISMTSRPKREGEKDGEVYHFVSQSEFEERIDRDDFLEWAIVHEKYYYGTLKKPILDGINSGNIVIREVDIQGFELIREILPQADFISVFIMPDSIENLIDRIKKRSKISDEEIERRIKSSQVEIDKSDECDYIIKNSDGQLAAAISEFEWIIQYETSK